MSESGLLEVDVVVKDVGAEGDENVEGLMDDGKDKDVEEKEKEKEEEARKKGVQSQTGERHLMPSVGVSDDHSIPLPLDSQDVNHGVFTSS